MAISFAKEIAPLFTPTDITCMSRGKVMLADYNYMSVPANAKAVLDRLDGSALPQMPPGNPWPQAQVLLFKSWIEGGYQP